jgi:hypothetical protein
VEFDDLFVRLGLKSRRGLTSKLKKSLVSEGYEDLELSKFVLAWWRRLRRHEYIQREGYGKTRPDPQHGTNA